MNDEEERVSSLDMKCKYCNAPRERGAWSTVTFTCGTWYDCFADVHDEPSWVQSETCKEKEI